MKSTKIKRVDKNILLLIRYAPFYYIIITNYSELCSAKMCNTEKN
ncbi:hypothetical protein KL86SPO_30428 [uncultured Sporomusa sp.]|uniref:Uncharacterized protein n=1 Tax=uncultured Sporomusa sp. TaxID=307249 RepID=A0A212LS32_9FIRM|nr:hypothetical protein KL86SPO_30428 [uncultured Sporomusa sp.]